MRLIPLLSAAQDEHGYLSEATLRELSRKHTIPLHRLQQLVVIDLVLRPLLL